MEELHNQIHNTTTPQAGQVYKMITLRGVVAFPGQTVNFDILRDKSLIALNKAMEAGQTIFLATQKNAQNINPAPKDIHRIGCLAQIKQVIRMPGDAVRVMAFATDRASIQNFVTLVPHFEVTVEPSPVLPSEPVLVEAIRRKISEQFEQYRKLNTRIPPDVDAALRISDSANFIGIFGTHILRTDEDKQKLLALSDEYSQLEEIYVHLAKECEILGLEKKINQKVNQNISKNQKDLFLREQIKVIHEELGDNADEILEFKERVEKKKLPKEAKERCLKEIIKLERMTHQGPEAAVSRGYIEWILDLEWDKQTKEMDDLKKARKVLDEDHYGIDKVKERIVEYLAVTKLTKELKGPILCFVGPPGVGKTSIAESIARASGRKFVNMSLGGVRDEAEIRGHRRTYIGALPGRIISAMKNAETINPVFLLDEIDKMNSDFRGDPASALLEVLDPNQNNKFKDHYLELPYDLSKVMFVTTANTLDSIPPPLLDRMEIIELSGYTQEEKLQIAKQYLIPKQTKANGLGNNQAKITDKVLLKIISAYTRESGVRNLEREIGTVCRKIAVKIVNGDIKKGEDFNVDTKHLTEFLGVERYIQDKALEADEIGMATGLAWTSVGGTITNVEVALIPNGKGDIVLTGSLGDVMRESCQTAMSLVKTRAEAFNISPESFKTNDIHVHFPEGGVPKDGPSAGITISTAILSAFSGKKISKTVAMTGEVTLRGKVLAIGGLKEKSLAAYRIGVKKIIIPIENKKDIKDLPTEVTNNIKIVCADTIDEVFANAFVDIAK